MVSIISRSAWGARAPRSRSYVAWSSREEFTLHYSTGPTSQTPRQIQDFHMDSNGWADIGYNFLVDHTGRIYEGRGWTVLGAHAAPRNVQGIGVCFIGGDNMTPAAKAAVVELYDEASRRAGRTLVRKGHRDINSTSCPGSSNYAWWKSKNYRDVSDVGGAPAPEPEYRREDRDALLERYEHGPEIEALQRELRLRGYAIEVDGYFGPQTERTVREYQADHALAVDGIAGPETLGHMGLADDPDDSPAPMPSAPAFPLPAGHWFGPESRDARNHSGFWTSDRPHVRRIRDRLRERGWRVAHEDRYDATLAAVVRQFQAEAVREGHDPGGVDGLVGARTWPLLWTKPIT
ncbi:peptidoglycan-binding domain-containing protein [Nocardiopsis gilva YIM 90087]|uniref:Peptidoglycan-binding domain-containing protein n=1 Tax=Nocardiopsis gilva YIM 90087 TaxID=1235441 RepID=A0A223S042_9ACTN|nr:peptidoglycan-binding domain-containing protein [Nocardiopsis gilva YIM 90087]